MSAVAATWAGALALEPGAALADAGDAVSLHLDGGAGTAFPITMGAQGVLELPFRIQVHADIGWMPKVYVDFINEVATGFDWYDESTASLIAGALQNSLVLRGSAGWRPFADYGLEVFAGYTLATLGGNVASADLVESVTQTALPPAVSAKLPNIPMSATVHGFQAGVGWRFMLWDTLVLRASLAYFQVFASRTTIDAQGSNSMEQAAIDRTETALDDYMDGIFTTYVKTALLGVYVSYRLF